MADLREAFQYASQNPTSDFAKNLESLASSGALDVDAKKFGIDLSPFKAKPEGFVDKTVADLKKRGSNIVDEFGSTATDMNKLDVTSPTSIVKTQVRPLETILRTAGQVAGGVNDIIGNAISSAIPDSVKDKASAIFDTPQGQQALGAIGKGMEAYNSWAKENPNLSKDLESVLNVASVIPVAKGGSMAVKAGLDTVEAGVKATRPVRDMTVGLASDVLKKGKSKATDLAKGVDGATLSEVISSPEVHPFVTANPANVKAVEEALKQGFEPKDVKFMASIQDADKEAIKKMKDLAEKASGNLRIQERPIDIVGENGIKTLKDIQNINAKAGAEVDATARALAGQVVDTSNLSEQALKLLADSGIKITMKQNGANVLDFSKSIFKKTPAITKTIERALSDLPNLSSDAYDLHKFKKSLDEVVNFGTAGEGLSGKAEGMLKQIRGIADDTLDNTFADYNKANTDFRKTRELLDEAHSLVGKKTDFLTTNAKLDFGQTMRSLFSNNKTRGRLTTFLDNLQKTADEFGVSSGHNLTDQALFSQILEGIYGTQAVTGLQGEVGKAIGTALKFKTNPLGATIEAGINAVEKARNITPEAKKKVLDLFMN
jgi:hypothetical protein